MSGGQTVAGPGPVEVPDDTSVGAVPLARPRLDSVDLLRGLVMVLSATRRSS
jgi:hypothetical protein